MASVRERGFAALNLVGLAICLAAYLRLARAASVHMRWWRTAPPQHVQRMELGQE
jgi:hypothetical protein